MVVMIAGAFYLAETVQGGVIMNRLIKKNHTDAVPDLGESECANI